MRNRLLFAGILLLAASGALAQSYGMTVHLKSGETVTIPLDDIQRIEFADIETGVQDPGSSGPALGIFRVMQNYPNPFNPSTTIEYEIPGTADVTVRIYDLQGAVVKELLHESQPAGWHRVTWDGTDGRNARVASGVYFYAVKCGGRALSQKLILVK